MEEKIICLSDCKKMKPNKITINEILREKGKDFVKAYRGSLTAWQIKNLAAIADCRTPAYGGRIEECDECGDRYALYNSCRNRHCPQCQTLTTNQWLEVRRSELLPCNYFHIVFTIPEELNKIIYANQEKCYSLFFRAVSETIKILSEDKRYLGFLPGFIAILHTWSQTLYFHPHLHCLVTAAGLDINHKWQETDGNFFAHIDVMSIIFKRIFTREIKFLCRKRELNIIERPEIKKFYKTIKSAGRQQWVVYSKPLLENINAVLEYFGRYTHRVAISNYRIISMKDDIISFRWKDYKDGGKKKIMPLEVSEFLHRFSMHILPKRFVKIRYYGLFNKQMQKKYREIILKQIEPADSINYNKTMNCIQLTFNSPEEKSKEKQDIQETIPMISNNDLMKCPSCKKGRLIKILEIEPLKYKRKKRKKFRAPPEKKVS